MVRQDELIMIVITACGRRVIEIQQFLIAFFKVFYNITCAIQQVLPLSEDARVAQDRAV